MKKIKDIRIAIVGSSYRLEITKNLIKHALATLFKAGINKENIDKVMVPGALEIPLIAKKLALRGVYDAIIVFGAVLKGQTYHFEQVANECVRGCMRVSYEFEMPIIFEVLCVYSLQDAIERSEDTEDNRGVEGALTALKMIKLMSTI